MEEMVDLRKEKVIILGGGIAGLCASFFLYEADIESVVFECSDTPGGLCKSFNIDGFWFDYGPHASFTKNKEIQNIFEEGVEIQTNVSSAVNYYKGIWIKNPVQNNLSVLPTSEKIKIILDMVRRNDSGQYNNYMEWLTSKYGEYFAENFPGRYTKKYWTIDAENLGTNWIGPRMYIPTLEEVLYGAFETSTKSVHYSGEIRYPINGGFGKFVERFIRSSNIECNQTITKIDVENKYIEVNKKDKIYYDYLISTLPLDKTGELYKPITNEVIEACRRLNHTSLVLVSLGLKGKIEVPETFYVYDEEMIMARGFSTCKYSKGSAPDDASTLQLEIYFSPFRPLTQDLNEIKEKTIEQCIEMKIMKRENIVVSDVRLVEYANVIFTKDINDNREIVHSYLNSNDVYYAGRFADWDYMWVDQTILSAKNMVNKLVERINLDEERRDKKTNKGIGQKIL